MEERNGVFISVYVCGGYRMRVCASPASPARGPRSPFAVSRPPNYLPLRSELNESRRVTLLSAVSPPSLPSDSHPRRAGDDRR